MKYFKSACKADLVKEFKRLAKALHPDNGGDAEAFKEMSAEFDGVELEICGSWLWASGCTYPFRAELKNAGFRFSSNKKMWYWHDGEYRRHSKKNLAMDEIRDRHGSVPIQKELRAVIA